MSDELSPSIVQGDSEEFLSLEEGDDAPKPEEPVHTGPRAADFVHAGQGGASGGDGVASEFDLDEDFDEAANDDEPEEDKTGFRSDGGGGHEFA